MKIVITESQFKQIVKESMSSRYMDYLLDKISEEGIESLSPEERKDLEYISKGRNVEKNIPSAVPQPVQSVGKEDEYDDEIDSPSEPEDHEDIDSPGGWNDGETFEMFMDSFHEILAGEPSLKVNVNGEDWKVGIKQLSDQPPTVVITNGQGKGMYVMPFWDGPGITIKLQTGQNAHLKVQNVPDSYGEMQYFIEEFVKSMCPAIIKMFYRKK